MTKQQRRIFDAYIAAGRCAHFYPRLKRVALSGFPSIPLADAIVKMHATLTAHK